jgi:two-component system, chemotaxis family, protein-glutamate methylesterase/glutaminase
VTKHELSVDLRRECTPVAEGAPWLVGIGASGPDGIVDLRCLLRSLPQDLNAVLLAVVHRPWELKSQLRQILEQESPMPIEIARHLAPLSRGHVYIGEPARHLTLGWRGCAELIEDPARAYSNRTVDLLFRTLGKRGAGRTIGVILAGALDDGSEGIRVLKASNGLAMIVPPLRSQMAETAAARLKSLDFVGEPPDIAREIVRVVRSHQRHPRTPTCALDS